MKLYNFKNFFNKSDNHNIHKICKRYGIENYNINSDRTINVIGDVSLSKKQLYSLPLRFNKINGHFNCNDNYLTSLEGCPNYVAGSFGCGDNQLSSLRFSPEYVGGDFYCGANWVLTSIEGCPKKMDRFFCRNTNVRDFNGFPEFYEKLVFFENSPVGQILIPIPQHAMANFINLLNEYDVIRNGKTIIRDRLAAAYEGIGMELPENITIKGYEIV